MSTLTLSLLTALIPLTNIWLNGHVFGLLADAYHTGKSFSDVSSPLLSYLGLMGLTALAGYAAKKAMEAISKLLGKRVDQHVSHLVIERLASMRFSEFDDHKFRSMSRRAIADASSRPLSVTQAVFQVASAAVAASVAGLYLVLWHWWLLVIVLIGPAVAIYAAAKHNKTDRMLVKGSAEVEHMASYFKGILTDTAAAKDVRMLGAKPFFLEKYRQMLRRVYNNEKARILRRFANSSIAGSFLLLERPVLVGYVASQLLAHNISFSQFTIYSRLITTLQSNLRSAAGFITHINDSVSALSDVFALLSPTGNNAFEIENRSETPSSPPTLEFRNVRFTYHGGKKPILTDVSFSLQPGERVVLVGSNGAGKSTITKLACGLYHPDTGQILSNGNDLSLQGPSSRRPFMSVVFQDFSVYNLSVEENIQLGDLTRPLDAAKLATIGKETGLDDMVQRLPHCYETILGRESSGGVELSIGQRQLVAVTRGLSRKVPILLLDEPTSALDTNRESGLMSRLFGRERQAARSVLVITHRLSLARQADRVLVLHEGRIIEEGPHDSLLAKGGRYSQLWANYHRNGDSRTPPINSI